MAKFPWDKPAYAKLCKTDEVGPDKVPSPPDQFCGRLHKEMAALYKGCLVCDVFTLRNALSKLWNHIKLEDPEDDCEVCDEARAVLDTVGPGAIGEGDE